MSCCPQGCFDIFYHTLLIVSLSSSKVIISEGTAFLEESIVPIFTTKLFGTSLIRSHTFFTQALIN